MDIKIKNLRILLICFLFFSITFYSAAFSDFITDQVQNSNHAEIVVNGESHEENNFSVFVLPEEKISISIGKINGDFIKKGAAVCSWLIPRESIIEEDENLDIKLIAPKTRGVYHVKLKIKYKDKEFLKKISIIVLIPLEDNKKINSYFFSLVNRIEKNRASGYISASIRTGLNLTIPKSVWNNQSNYEAIPKGIIEVTKKDENTYISEHFKLKDFVCKGDAYPKLICLNYNLIRKLELLIDELESMGHKINTIAIMSGFRTPWYNKKINVTRFSRHIYGDAADIYIDNDNNKRMDDLNKDRKINIKDAKYLAGIINEMDLKGIYPGGLHVYAGNKYRGPFVHVDTRGYIIRW